MPIVNPNRKVEPSPKPSELILNVIEYLKNDPELLGKLKLVEDLDTRVEAIEKERLLIEGYKEMADLAEADMAAQFETLPEYELHEVPYWEAAQLSSSSWVIDGESYILDKFRYPIRGLAHLQLENAEDVIVKQPEPGDRCVSKNGEAFLNSDNRVKHEGQYLLRKAKECECADQATRIETGELREPELDEWYLFNGQAHQCMLARAKISVKPKRYSILKEVEDQRPALAVGGKGKEKEPSLTVGQVANRLRISESDVNNLIEQNEISAIKEYFVPESALLAYLEDKHKSADDRTADLSEEDSELEENSAFAEYLSPVRNYKADILRVADFDIPNLFDYTVKILDKERAGELENEDTLIRLIKENNPHLDARLVFYSIIEDDYLNTILTIGDHKDNVFGMIACYADADAADLNDLYVGTSYQKTGCGLTLVIKAARESKEKYNYLTCSIQNWNKPAQMLAEKLGFKEIE